VSTPIGVSGPGSPYLTPRTLRAASTGISWGTIPNPKATVAERLAEQMNICQRASGDADAICHQVLRATLDTEQGQGPGSTRVNIQRDTGLGVITARRFPILQVVSVQTATARGGPQNWSPVPSGRFWPAEPATEVYGTSAPSAVGEGSQQILVASGYIRGPRLSQFVQWQYVNGWPHAGVTVTAMSGATELEVDDCTGWAPVTDGAQGALGVLQDGGKQETFTCTAASAASGPGTLTLASPLVYQHDPGVLATTLPAQAQLAMIYLCVAQALERGATATVHAQMPGTMTGAGADGQDAARKEAARLLGPFARWQ